MGRGAGQETRQVSPEAAHASCGEPCQVLTRVLVLIQASELLSDVLLLQVEEALLLLLQPAEAPPPEGRVLVHQTPHLHLRLVGGGVARLVIVPLGRHTLFFIVHLAIILVALETKRPGYQGDRQQEDQPRPG